MDGKETLHTYLRIRRDNLLGKLDGLGDYDMRRPLTPTGTNLLGLVKLADFAVTGAVAPAQVRVRPNLDALEKMA